MEIEFEKVFRELTGHCPLSWQTRLYDHFVERDGKVLPSVIDLPTGLGKTMVMAIWLIARARQIAAGSPNRLPTRLVYVVDRRTVVDQATDLVENKLLKNFALSGLPGQPPSISTLRGQFADNREWTRDPSRPAIIVGTVDMIGSRLLFSGYACSAGQKSIHAGLLGHDSLIVLDEAHLSPAFNSLLSQLHATQSGDDISLQRPQIREPMPMRVVSMSATLDTRDESDRIFRLSNDDLRDLVVHQRINAAKRLAIHITDDVRATILARAKLLASRNQRVIVFVRSPEGAKKIADALSKIYSNSVDLLTGTMRGKERDAQINDKIKHPVFNRLFAARDPDPGAGPCFLVATAAGEVGVDFNADHLVCDLTPIDSIIQRLGRVNRRGEGAAEVHLVVSAKPEKSPKPFDHSCAATLDLLNSMPPAEDGTRDVSPLALRRLATTPEAISPKPRLVPLNEFILDAWSMTSIRTVLPGRPPVAPWLRGIDEDETPHTIVAWRIELDHLDKEDALRQSLDDYPLKPHELLSDRSDKIAKAINTLLPAQYGRRALIIGANIECVTLGELARRNKDRLIREVRDKTLVLPASIGGIEYGFLADDWNQKLDQSSSADVADIIDERQRDAVSTRPAEPDESDGLTHIDDLDVYISQRSKELGMRYVGSAEFPMREKDEEPSEWFLYFARDVEGNRNWRNVKQSLDEHVKAVVDQVQSVAAGASLDADLCTALGLAALYHDTGKERELWQTYARRGPSDPILGKSNRYLDWRMLCFDPGNAQAVFRHEFGSLVDATVNSQIKMHKHRELIWHLIASHHGHARPHFNNSLDPSPPGDVDPAMIAADVPVRFASLQRVFGRWGLAWLEALLRCADQRASADASDMSKEDRS